MGDVSNSFCARPVRRRLRMRRERCQRGQTRPEKNQADEQTMVVCPSEPHWTVSISGPQADLTMRCQSWLMGGQIGPRRVACPTVCLSICMASVGLPARLACLAACSWFAAVELESQPAAVRCRCAHRAIPTVRFVRIREKKRETKKAQVVGRCCRQAVKQDICAAFQEMLRSK
ncbi:hypothetical protein BKA80DRAFT_28758 [Phyllosticta citrichinensis]